MIPLRLQVRNFMCYAENVPPLLLDGVHVVCLSGDNGHGKSALLDAITWALWGRARGKGDDDLVHLGKTDMEVDLEFAVGGERYRVIRKRALKGKRGTTVLEFQVHGDTYRPVTGDTIHETQRKINAVLRMEYETFVNSAMLLQGRADEFTIKPPAERKKVLADVLGLRLYDELEDRARQRMREAEQTRRELTAVLAEIDRELEERPEYQAARDLLATELEAVSRDLTVQEAARRAAMAAKQLLDAKRQQLEELKTRWQREQSRLRQVEEQIAADRAELAVHEKTVADRPEIESAYERLIDLRARNEEMGKRASRLLSLRKEESRLQQLVAGARAHLETEARVCEAAIARVEKKVGRRQVIERELDELQRKIAAMADLEARRDELREAAQRLTGEVQSLKTANERLSEAIQVLKQKVLVLKEGGATCPVCGSELGANGRAQLEESYKAEGRAQVDVYRSNEARAKDCAGQAARALAAATEIEGQLAGRETLRRQAGGMERELLEAVEAEGERLKAGQALAAVTKRLGEGDYARVEQAALTKVRADVVAVGYDESAHEGLRGDLLQLSGVEERRASVQRSVTAVELLRQKIEQAERALSGQRLSLGEATAHLQDLSGQVAEGGRVLQELAEAEDKVEVLANRASDIRLKLGRAEQLVSRCEHLAHQRQDKGKALDRAVEERGIYEDLAVAFGKKGIQAMIIDGAIPEIEDEANLILARLTDGRMSVKVETQRESKSGDGVIETLDIKIADELGYRQYEMYSGGEAFRVNFAIRIALSKLLARRAGARLQTLIMDEGFGTQDASGRERLVEAINSVGEDFECILVITHIQELKDAFPMRIDVVKTGEGSTFTVTE